MDYHSSNDKNKKKKSKFAPVQQGKTNPVNGSKNDDALSTKTKLINHDNQNIKEESESSSDSDYMNFSEIQDMEINLSRIESVKTEQSG